MALVHTSTCVLAKPIRCRDVYTLLTRTDLISAHYRDVRATHVVHRGLTETKMNMDISVQLPLHLGTREETVTLSVKLNEKTSTVTTTSKGICHVTTNVYLHQDGCHVSQQSVAELVNIPFFAKPVAKHVARSMMERMSEDTEALLIAGVQ